MTLDELSKALKASVVPGGLVIFQVPPEHIPQADRKLREIEHIFKKYNVGLLLFSDECTIIMVPEARRVIAMPIGVA